MSAPDPARERLADRQAALVAALGGRAHVPAGFDVERVHLAGRTLDAKRRKAVARAMPALADALADRFPETFADFAAEHPPGPNGPAADGFAFAAWLDVRGELPAAAAREFLAAQLWRGRPFALRVRRRGPRGLILGIRLPLLGVRVIQIGRG